MVIEKPKIIAIVGPTSSGKSELAVKIAKKFNGEIISADSRQVYRGLDIGTGKVMGRWKDGKFLYKGIAHYCIDFVSPKSVFTAAGYKKCAEDAVGAIIERGKVPIFAGGTGFYIDAALYDFSLPGVSPNQTLRSSLSLKKPRDLHRLLKALDPRRAKTIDPDNPRRLIRSIEIAKALGKVPELKRRLQFNTLWLGIALPRHILERRIYERLGQRVRRGMLNETRSLRRNGLTWKRFYQLGLEYRFLAEYLQKRIGKKEMLALLEKAIKDYSLRQMTWFRKNKNIHWTRSGKEAEKIAAKFLGFSSAPK